MTDTEKKEWKLYPITSPGYTGRFNFIHNPSQYCIGMVPPDKVDLIRNLIERPQDNNALIPLDRNKMWELCFDCGEPVKCPKNAQELRDLISNVFDRVCAKFGKDNSGMVPISDEA